MPSALQWVLLGIVAYWLGVLWLRRQDLLPEYVGTQGPILTLHTTRFRALLDRLARPKRAWRAWGNFGVGVSLVLMVGLFAFLVLASVATVRNPTPSVVNQPRNVLVIPGVNQFLPLSVAPEIVLGLLIGLVVHEGGHGVMCRVGDIDIESVGLAFLAFIPVGAFVEPDEDSRRRADRGDQTRMFAAGVMNNFAVTLLAFALLFGPVVASIGVAGGAAIGGVLPGSAAAEAGIEQGDRIVAVNGRPIGSNDDLDDTLSTIDAREVTVRVVGPEERWTATVTRSLLVTGAAREGPFAGAVGVGTTITAVNGTTVHTETAFRKALDDRRIATLATDGGETATGPVGAFVRIAEGGPIAAAGAPAGADAVITAIGGERVVSARALDRVLEDTRPGQTVTVEAYIGGERRTYEVTLGEHPSDGHGFVGVFVAPGISGLVVDGFGTKPYPAGEYLRALGGGDGLGISFLRRTIVALQLPLVGVTGGGLPFNFAGFTGGIANFYTPTGPLGFLGGLVFTLANVLFWTGWINLNLGIFNLIPAFPLDGGHILRTATEAIVSRLPVPVDRRRAVTTAVTTSVGLAMLGALLLTIFGPQLLT